MKKFVIWGPKLHQDTFSYVHFGFYRSIESLGHQVSWYSDGDDVSSVDFSDSWVCWFAETAGRSSLSRSRTGRARQRCADDACVSPRRHGHSLKPGAECSAIVCRRHAL